MEIPPALFPKRGGKNFEVLLGVMNRRTLGSHAKKYSPYPPRERGEDG
jgi:hypothetical protein